MDKGELIASIATTILGSSVINGFVTHILYNSKLAKERKAKGTDAIADKIQNSLEMFRELELKLKTVEIYLFEEELEEKGSSIDLINPECVYPEIFNDWDSYNSFQESISSYRKNHEKNLSCELALMLIFIDRYLHQLSIYMAEYGDENILPTFGAILISDLQFWRRDVDKKLIREINRVTYKLETHEGIRWRRKRKRILENRWKHTILYYLINGNCRRKDKKTYEMVRTVIESFREENE